MLEGDLQVEVPADPVLILHLAQHTVSNEVLIS